MEVEGVGFLDGVDCNLNKNVFCVDCQDCFNCSVCLECSRCNNCDQCFLCQDCVNCEDCISCVGLRDKKDGYWLRNERVSKQVFDAAFDLI